MPRKTVRKEKVLVGTEMREVWIPADAYWGAETLLALENYRISGRTTPKAFLDAVLSIKKAAALTHKELGVLDIQKAYAIVRAADEALLGRLDAHFVVDAYNSGAGTSFHMNVNEVLANRAAYILTGKMCCDHTVIDPHNDVNYGQSTNDVIPTAIRIASLKAGIDLAQTLLTLERVLDEKAGEFKNVRTAGRTHTKDALPITWGNRFGAYRDRLHVLLSHLERVLLEFPFLGIGGSAVGTGVNTKQGYRERMCKHLSEICLGTEYIQMRFRPHPNPFAAMSGMGEFLIVSGVLRALAIELTNIAKDLEISSSGPNAGINELILPSVQPGSSIMPGKVNPSMAENLSIVCSRVIGNSGTVDHASGMTQWELNTRMPVIGIALIESFEILKNAVTAFTEKCVKGMRVNEAQCRLHYENTSSWFTLLNTFIGYAQAADLAREVSTQVESTNETILTALIRIARERSIRTHTGEELTEGVLDRMAFPQQN